MRPCLCQVRESIADLAFLNCRPSVIAAAILYTERRVRGIIPFWPSMLGKLTGYQVCLSACCNCAAEATTLTPLVNFIWHCSNSSYIASWMLIVLHVTAQSGLQLTATCIACWYLLSFRLKPALHHWCRICRLQN